MEAYKFEVTVQEDGTIRIPEISKFANRDVEIFIMVKPKTNLDTKNEQFVRNFLGKWKGLLKGVDPEQLKAKYLQEKYG